MLWVTAQAVHRLPAPPTIPKPHKRLTALAGPSGGLSAPGTMSKGPKPRSVAAGALLTLVPGALNQLLRGLFVCGTRYTSFDQGLSLLGPGLGVLAHRRGHLFCCTYILP